MDARLRQMAEILALCYFVNLIEGMPARVDLPVVYPKAHPGEQKMNLTRPRSHREDVMFPTDLLKLDPPTDRFGMPHCVTSSKATFCENVTNYPADRIRRMMKFSPNEFANLFGAKGINGRRTISYDDLSDEPICRIRSQAVLPKLAKNDQNKWRYVINDIDYVQSVNTDQCEKEGADCAYIQDSLPSGYRSFCKQRYSYKRLVAIDPEQENPIRDSFSFPSCCSCYVKIPSIHERLNSNKRNMSPATRSRRNRK